MIFSPHFDFGHRRLKDLWMCWPDAVASRMGPTAFRRQESMAQDRFFRPSPQIASIARSRSCNVRGFSQFADLFLPQTATLRSFPGHRTSRFQGTLRAPACRLPAVRDMQTPEAPRAPRLAAPAYPPFTTTCLAATAKRNKSRLQFLTRNTKSSPRPPTR
jgi:hypothetical protein